MSRSRHIARAMLVFAAAVWLVGGPASATELSWSQEVRARVFKLLTDGIKAYKEGRPKDAIPLLTDASDVALNSFTAYYYLGLALKADRQYERAIDPLQVAIELDPTNLQARVALADCFLKHGEPAEALAEYHRVIAKQEDYAPAWDGLGRAAESGGDDEEAVKNYRKAIELNPGFPDASLNLGDLLLRHGRGTEAIELFLKAIRVRPDFAAAYNRLGVAYAQQRLYNEAIAALRQAQSLEKGNPWHPVTIGGIFMQLDSLVEAAHELDAALVLDPDYLEGYLGKAALQRRHGDLDAAVATLDAGLARNVEEEHARAQLKESRARIVDESARMKTQLALTESEPASSAAWAGMAEMKAELGDHATAVSLYKKALDLHPESEPDPSLLGRMGYSALRCDMYAEAAAAYEKLAQRQPPDPGVLVNLGLARTGLGDAEGAEKALREAARLMPGDYRPSAYLANLYVLWGRKDQAIEALGASIALTGEGAVERQRLDRLLKALSSSRPEGS